MPRRHSHGFQKSRYCHDCDRNRLVERQARNGWLHFLLILLTCGLWLPVFVVLESFPSYRCQWCGSKV